MKRFAAIDIGTNSVKATVADTDDTGALHIVHEDSEVTRLGAGVDASKRLSEEAMSRTLSAIARLAADARAQGAVEIAAVGTSALRDAANGRDFLARVQQEADLNVEIITGDREAQLAYAAVYADPDLGLPPDFSTVAFDIGGGSTELTYGSVSGLERHRSLDIGAVRITERFLHSDPPTAAEKAEAAKAIRSALYAFPPPDSQPILVGLGGTAVNVAAVTLAQASAPAHDVHATLLFEAEAQIALARFAAVPTAARRDIPGLEPARAEVIVGGALILIGVLEQFHSDRFLVSTRGLRYGLLAELARNATAAQ